MPRRKINKPNFLNIDGITYSFYMTDHLNHQLPISEDDILKEICTILSAACKEPFPIYARLQGDFRIILVTKWDKLYKYLDEESKSHQYNYLIFVRKNDCRTIVHFGPFGWKKNEEFEKRVCETRDALKKLEVEYNDLKSPNYNMSEEWKETRMGQILAHVKAYYEALRTYLQLDAEEVEKIKAELMGKYWAPMPELELEIDAKKKELLNLTSSVFKDSVKRLATEALINSINVTAITTCLIRNIIAELVETLVKEIAKEMAKTAGKAAAKTGSKSGGKTTAKKIPFVGLAVGAACGAWRLCQGDIAGASMEVVSGAVACVPGAGTVTSLAIDAYLVTSDISWAISQAREQRQKFLSQARRIEYDLNHLSERYQKALAEYEFVKEVLEDPGFCIGKLKHEIQLLEKISAVL